MVHFLFPSFAFSFHSIPIFPDSPTLVPFPFPIPFLSNTFTFIPFEFQLSPFVPSPFPIPILLSLLDTLTSHSFPTSPFLPFLLRSDLFSDRSRHVRLLGAYRYNLSLAFPFLPSTPFLSNPNRSTFLSSPSLSFPTPKIPLSLPSYSFLIHLPNFPSFLSFRCLPFFPFSFPFHHPFSPSATFPPSTAYPFPTSSFPNVPTLLSETQRG